MGRRCSLPWSNDGSFQVRSARRFLPQYELHYVKLGMNLQDSCQSVAKRHHRARWRPGFSALQELERDVRSQSECERELAPEQGQRLQSPRIPKGATIDACEPGV